MNQYIKAILLGCVCSFAFLFSSARKPVAAPSADTTISFKVFGVCEMCRKRIEAAALGKGVAKAQWDVETKMLSLTYNPNKTEPAKVSARIAAAGHDTHDRQAKSGVYNNLPACCRFREFSSMEEMHGNEVPAPLPVKTTELPVVDSVQTVINFSTISGTVFGSDGSGKMGPLAGATIQWKGAANGTASDESGNFTMPANSSRTLVISYVGYEPEQVHVRDTNHLNVVLSKSRNLQEVRVTAGGRASTYINSYDPIRTLTITQKELKKAACCNLSESFETNPSVDVSFNDAVTGSKQIQLLGLAGNYTQLTVENLPGPRGLATAQGLNSIPGTWIEGIQLVKGTGSVANGFESIAGQINVELKKPVTSERLYANVYVNDYGKTDLNLNLSTKLGKRWSTTLLLHDAFLNNNRIDFNKDGFRDLPTGNLLSGINRWSYTNEKGLTAHFGVKFLEDNKVGGQVAFDPERDKGTTRHYGLEIRTARREVFGKIGYVFPGQEHKSIGLQLSTFRHKQNAYFGLRTYDAQQNNAYANLIYQSRIGTDKHTFRTGLSMQYDQYAEVLQANHYARKEVVPGAFFEYTFRPLSKVDVVAGIREDHNNLYGWFTTPRLNVRYEPVKGTTLRASIGRGQRTANIFAENNSVLVSAREIRIEGQGTDKAYGLNPEVAWNKGVSVDQKLKLFHRTATLSAEYFRNDFQNQIIVDLEQPNLVRFYNLKGKSIANSFQTEFAFEPMRKLQVRLAYRYFDVRSTYGGQVLQRPFTAKHRAFANLGYEVKNWKFDYTVSLNGKKRVPGALTLPAAYSKEPWSPAYTLMNAQISKTIGRKKNIDIYLGGENLTNYFQQDAIIAADQPFGNHFDASMVWGPVNGRMLYGGIRYTLK